jgi:dolichyl-phosphooligosaccharide-protein glycotransferase
MSESNKESSHHATHNRRKSSDTMKVLSVLGIIILMLIPIFISLHVRMQPLSLSGIETRVESAVLNSIYNQIAASVRAQYPGVPDAELAELVQDRFLEQVNQPGFDEELRNYVEEVSESQKNYYRHEGSDWNYMQDIDTYHWLRLTENIIETGQARDTTINGTPWDTYVLAPVGRSMEQHNVLHPYIVAGFHNIVSQFTDFTVERSYIYHSVFYALVVLLTFIVTWRITNVWGGFFAAMMIALVPGSLGRTLFGRASTDIWNVLFPLLILFLFLEAMVQKKKLYKYLFAGAAGLASVIFAAIWDAWWHVADFILAIAGIYILYIVILDYINTRRFKILSLWKKPVIQNTMIITGIYIVSVFILGILLLGKAGLVLDPIQGPFGALQLKDATRGNFFPNVHTTVAELRPVDNLSSVISALLGNVQLLNLNLNWLLFIMSISGILGLIFFTKNKDGALVFFTKNKEGTIDLRYTLGLAIWVIVTIFITLRGVRFVILLSPAFSVGFGIAMGIMLGLLMKSLISTFSADQGRILGLQASKFYSGVVMCLVVVLLSMLIFFSPQVIQKYDGSSSLQFYGLYGQAMDIARSDIPMVDDDFYRHLTYIRDNSNEDAIMTSWWDFGHYFKYIADRRVTFDGGTQSSHAAHWAGRLFITDNEREAVGIKRMLDCSAAFTFININGNVEPDEFKALYLIEDLILLDEPEAREMLAEQGYSQSDIEYVLAQTHCNPSQGLVVASGDMQGKAGVWGHFGSWSFERADIYNKIREGRMRNDQMILYIQDRLGIERTPAAAIYHQLRQFTVPQAEQWIAPYPSIYGIAGCIEDSAETILCEANVGAPVEIIIDRSTMNATAMLRGQGNAVQSFHIRLGHLNAEGEYIVTGPDENQIGLGASLLRDGSGYVVMLSDPAYVGSVFSLMYYYDGQGLSCFELFRSDRWATGGKLNTYTPNYQCDYDGGELTYELREYASPIAMDDNVFIIDNMTQDEIITIVADEDDELEVEDIVSINVEEASNE